VRHALRFEGIHEVLTPRYELGRLEAYTTVLVLAEVFKNLQTGSLLVRDGGEDRLLEWADWHGRRVLRIIGEY
jgi:predicted polyphosphate/ATP-dependent NAD kinase